MSLAMSGDGLDGTDDDDDDIPLQARRPFCSGRKDVINFVPASSEDPEATEQRRNNSEGQSISEYYLSLVLEKPDCGPEQTSEVKAAMEEDEEDEEACEICKLPLTPTRRSKPSTSTTSTTSTTITTTATTKVKKAVRQGTDSNSHHNASIAHQVCLAHSHPPTALDRTRMGLMVLESQGWDPDSRTGLGATGQGTQYPIKPKLKNDKLGIGVVVIKGSSAKKDKERPPSAVGAKKVRKMAADDRRRTEKLHHQLFGRLDLERYLGRGA